jgi:hypothetical protein
LRRRRRPGDGYVVLINSSFVEPHNFEAVPDPERKRVLFEPCLKVPVSATLFQ